MKMNRRYPNIPLEYSLINLVNSREIVVDYEKNELHIISDSGKDTNFNQSVKNLVSEFSGDNIQILRDGKYLSLQETLNDLKKSKITARIFAPIECFGKLKVITADDITVLEIAADTLLTTN